MQAPTAKLEPKHHESLYFPDGDIILSAKNGEETVLLRLHRFMLSHHSPVFKDMFSLPTSHQIDDTYDGTLVIVMHDTCADLAALMDALYNPESLHLVHHDPNVYTEVRPILTLARKYQIDSVIARIVRHIEDDWPTCPWTWCATRKQIEHWAALSLDGQDHFPPEGQTFSPEPVAAIRLAMDFEIWSILPAAFYRLAVSQPYSRRAYIGADIYVVSPRWDMLSEDEWRQYTEGRAALIAASKELPQWLKAKIGARCGSRASCRRALCGIRVTYMSYMNAHFRERPDIFTLLIDKLIDRDSFEDFPSGLCGRCFHTAQENIRDFLEYLWEELPFMFDLPTTVE